MPLAAVEIKLKLKLLRAVGATLLQVIGCIEFVFMSALSNQFGSLVEECRSVSSQDAEFL